MKNDITAIIEAIKTLISEAQQLEEHGQDSEYETIAEKFCISGKEAKKILQKNYPKSTESLDKKKYAQYFLESISEGIKGIKKRTSTQVKYMKSFVQVLEHMLDFFEKINIPTELYHFTKCESMYRILESKELIPGKDGYVSMTRNDKFYEIKNPSLGIKNHRGPQVRIKLDRAKLSLDYNIEIRCRYHYAGDEQEEAIKSPILDITKYILEITVLKEQGDDNDLHFSFSDKVLNDPKCSENIENKLTDIGIPINTLQI